MSKGGQAGFDDSGFKLFIGGLSYSTDDIALKTYFEKYGPLTDYVVMKMSDSKRSRGFGFVSFKNEEDLEKCMDDKPHELDGRTVDTKRATPRDETETKDKKGRNGLGNGTANGDTEDKIMRKLFIGGLNYTTKEDDMQKYFERYGPLEDCVVMKFPDSGRSRGFGFIVFEKGEMVDNCQSDRPHILDNKTIETKRATPKTDSHQIEAKASVTKMFVGNLGEDTENEEVEEYFQQFGKVESVEQMKWNDTQKKRGFGFVQFNDTDTVDKICLLGGHSINGRKVDVKKALSKQELELMKRAKAEEEYTGRGSGGGGNYGMSGFGRGSGGRGGGRSNMMGGGDMGDMNPMAMMDMMMSMMQQNGGGGGMGFGRGAGKKEASRGYDSYTDFSADGGYSGGGGGGYSAGYGSGGGGARGYGGGSGYGAGYGAGYGGGYGGGSNMGNYQQGSGGGPMRGPGPGGIRDGTSGGPYNRSRM